MGEKILPELQHPPLHSQWLSCGVSIHDERRWTHRWSGARQHNCCSAEMLHFIKDTQFHGRSLCRTGPLNDLQYASPAQKALLRNGNQTASIADTIPHCPVECNDGGRKVHKR